MTIHSLRTLEGLFTRDDERIDGDEARRLIEAVRDGGEVDLSERTALNALPNTTDDARHVIDDFLATPRSPPPMRAMTGFDGSTFDDDILVLDGVGSLSGGAGVTPYSRGWAAVSVGPLRHAHGSKPPDSKVLTPEERTRLERQPPGRALDLAAKSLQVSLGEGFEALATKSSSYDPQAPSWWGKCHAWAWAALSTELAARVDVGGPEGERGLWLAGEWLSRADLGNFLMGVADRIALSDPALMFDADVTALDLLQATTQLLVSGGGGFVADVHHDASHGGDREVWNQPFVGADANVSALPDAALRELVELSKRDGNADAVSARRIEVTARYGNEQSDDWEGPWAEGKRRWNVYAVTDASGVVVSAYFADDVKLNGIPELPTRETAEPLEYIWRPTLEPIRAGLEGRPNPVIDADLNAREYRFFLGTVLNKGIPGAMRKRFEAEVAGLPSGPLTKEQSSRIHQRYPGIAGAYTAEQWKQNFASRGL